MQRATAAAVLVSAQVVSMVKEFSGETYESVAIDDAGQSIYVVATSSQFGTNPRLERQIFAPTLLSWDPDPQSTRYDVVRGDLSSLAIVGSTVDLGPVTCIEDDSPDNATAGDEDPAQPSPGQTLFYLYRGTKGEPPVTASWGQGTGARERIAAACNP